jgi:hypothetical protein
MFLNNLLLVMSLVVVSSAVMEEDQDYICLRISVRNPWLGSLGHRRNSGSSSLVQVQSSPDVVGVWLYSKYLLGVCVF